MNELFEIFALNLWFALAFLAARALWRFAHSKILATIAFVGLAIAPYWNVLPAYFAYRDAVAKDGGTTIARRVDADSFLIRNSDTTGDVLTRCGAARFCEPVLFERLAAAELPELPAKATPSQQFVRLSVGREGDPRCAELAEYSKQVSADGFWKLQPGHCFATERVAAPASRYSVETLRSGTYPTWNNIPLHSRATIVRDMVSGEMVAQSRRYTADPQPLWSAMPQFQFDNGVAELRPEDLRK